MDVTVLIPAYQPAGELVALVKALKQENFRIVVVDDGKMCIRDRSCAYRRYKVEKRSNAGTPTSAPAMAGKGNSRQARSQQSFSIPHSTPRVPQEKISVSYTHLDVYKRQVLH